MRDLPKSQSDIPPVKKTLRVDLPIEVAFQLFTEQVNEWWPIDSHSVGGQAAAATTLEGKPGGRFYETQNDGSQVNWGRVLDWEPPKRIVLSFYPGRAVDSAQRLVVSFCTEAGGTRLTLVHSGWERLAEQASAVHRNFEYGWDPILESYAEQATHQLEHQ